MKSALSKRQPKALAKVVVATDTDKVVGFHMVGPNAAEIIQVRLSQFSPRACLHS